MLLFLILLVPLVASQSLVEKVYYAPENAEHYFEEFIRTYNKQYSNKVEKDFRFNIFKENLKEINKDNARSQVVYGVTQFADLTMEEFKRYYTGLGEIRADYCNAGELQSNVTAPNSWDWRQQNAVTGVKNQGNCGSCWAFSTTGNIEGQYAINHKRLVEVSEQQLVDCVNTNSGCGGGLPSNAMLWLSQNGGCASESAYPYERVRKTCKTVQQSVVQVTGCKTFTASEEQLKELLVSVGPLSVGMDGSLLNRYPGGVYDCSGPVSINHAVLLVGYGNEGGQPYWIIKNSYGSGWGEQGYLRLAMGKNSCGILDLISSAVIA